MKSTLVPVLAAILTAQLPCLAFEEKNILAAGDWSEPVAGVPDKNIGRGAHRPIIRGRLLLCESPKNHQAAAYLELQDCGDTWGSTTEIHCDMGGFRFDLTDTKGQPLELKSFAFSGGAPGAHWMTLPCDSTVRLRISPYASFSFASTEDYFMSGTFVVNPPADHTGLDVWQGTLKLPAMKIVVPKRIPDAAPAAPTATSVNLSFSPETQAVLDMLFGDTPAAESCDHLVGGTDRVPPQLCRHLFQLAAVWLLGFENRRLHLPWPGLSP